MIWIKRFDIRPAPTSSIVIPKPPGRFSRVLTNNGFQTSKSLNKKKAITRLVIEKGTKSIATKIPATSSITTHKGSFELNISIE